MVTLGDERDALARADELAVVERELRASLDAAQLAPVLPAPSYLPILDADRLVGLWTTDARAGASSFFIRPAARGQGFGDAIVEQLAELGHDLLVPARSPALGYFQERGYLPLGIEERVLCLQAPTRVANRRPAASVCLLEAGSRQVLIGQRLTPPWPGYWAFPGGKLEPGEPPLVGALRELREETGIALSNPDVLLETRVYAGGSGTVYAIDNFCIRAPECYPPELDLPELRPYWVALDSAARLRPMAAGTRRVIRRIRRLASSDGPGRL